MQSLVTRLMSNFNDRPVYLTHNPVFACMATWTTSLDIQSPDNFFLFPEAPLRTEARGICHSCHMDNPALNVGTHRSNVKWSHFTDWSNSQAGVKIITFEGAWEPYLSSGQNMRFSVSCRDHAHEMIVIVLLSIMHEMLQCCTFLKFLKTLLCI